jgi:hypothetical protein
VLFRSATLLQHRADEQATSLALELRGAYPPAAGLASLQRTVTLHRQRPAWVELEDRVRFAAAPGTLESVLTTFGTATEEGQGTVLLQGERGALRVGYDATLLRCRIEVVPQVDLAAGPRDVTRVCFAPAEPLLEATIRLQLIPFP